MKEDILKTFKATIYRYLKKTRTLFTKSKTKNSTKLSWFLLI